MQEDTKKRNTSGEYIRTSIHREIVEQSNHAFHCMLEMPVTVGMV